MKVLMVLERDFPPDIRVENQIKSLISFGHTVVLGCYTFNGETDVSDWHGCRVYKKRIPSFTSKCSIGALRLPIYFNFWREHLRSIIAKEKPDAIHVHDLPLAQVGSEIKKKYNIPLTLDLHENWPAYLRASRHANTFLGRIISLNWQWEQYEMHQCLNADHVIVVIDEAKDRLVEAGIPETKIKVVANYPQLSDFNETNDNTPNPDAPVLFYAGGIAKHRGLQFTIEALPTLKRIYPNIKLWLLGDGNYKQHLDNMVNKLGVGDNVHFFGHVPYTTVLEKLNASTIALIPHEKSDHTDTTIPHKLFQYMYAGKPVVASNCSPIERIVNESNAGSIYQWDSSADFAEKTDLLLGNLSNYNPMNVRKEIEAKYNWDIEARKLHEIYMGCNS